MEIEKIQSWPALYAKVSNRCFLRSHSHPLTHTCFRTRKHTHLHIHPHTDSHSPTCVLSTLIHHAYIHTTLMLALKRIPSLTMVYGIQARVYTHPSQHIKVIMTELYPRSEILICVQVLQSDGGDCTITKDRPSRGYMSFNLF